MELLGQATPQEPPAWERWVEVVLVVLPVLGAAFPLATTFARRIRSESESQLAILRIPTGIGEIHDDPSKTSRFFSGHGTPLLLLVTGFGYIFLGALAAFPPLTVIGVVLVFSSGTWLYLHLLRYLFTRQRASPDNAAVSVLVEGDRKNVAARCIGAIRALRAKIDSLDIDQGMVRARYRRPIFGTRHSLVIRFLPEGPDRYSISADVVPDQPSAFTVRESQLLVLRLVEYICGFRIYQEHPQEAHARFARNHGEAKGSPGATCL